MTQYKIEIGLHLMGNVKKRLAKIILIPLGLKAVASIKTSTNSFVCKW